MKKRITETIAIFIFGLASCLVATLWDSAHSLQVNEYTFKTSKIEEEITLAVISDLHEMEFGEGNRLLIEQISDQSPDLIFVLGDMINEESSNPQIVYELIEDISDIAPVYYAPGNHEFSYMEQLDAQVLEQIEAAGAVVLDWDYVDIEVKGTDLRIGGFYGYAFWQNYYQPQLWLDTQVFLQDYVDTDHLKIMLSHRPDSFIFSDASRRWDIDLVLSGHMHGGQVVLPILGGISGGDQGWFPEYVHGLYQKDNIHMFVTSGLGTNPEKVPRINNLPEIAVIHMVVDDE